MPIKGPTYDTLISKVPNKFLLTLLVAKRARDLNSGASSMLRTGHKNPLLTALDEAAKGKISPESPKEDQKP